MKKATPRRRVARGSAVALLGALGLVAFVAHDALAVEARTVKPAAERSVQGTADPKRAPKTQKAAGKPDMRGPKVPPQMRAQLKAQLDARVESNVQKARALRGEAIGLLSKFVAESPKESREMPEALMRLGELRWEAEREAFVERFAAWEKRAVDQRGPPPTADFGPARELFGRVLRDYPGHAEYDLALYVDGFLATEQGKQDEALDRFARILRDHPTSRFVPDAHMARAEALFGGKNDYAGALAAYEQVLRYKKTDLYGLALFKSAWCLWRLGRSEEAAKRFVSVFEVTDPGARSVTLSERKQLDELEGEALRYLVEVFTEDDKNTATDMYRFLTQIGGERFATKIVLALAETFYEQAHYERGIESYELLLKLEPTSRDAGTYVLAIAQGYSLTENYPRLKATYERALRDYTSGGSWTRTQADAANVAQTGARIEAQLFQDAAVLHQRAQRDKTSRAEYEGAASLYEVYLSKFGGAPRAYQVHFNLAETYFFHLDRPTDAATHYLAAARAIPDKDGKTEPLRTMRHDALFNAMAALERVRTAELESKRQKGNREESEADKKFAEALDLYIQLYPTDPALPELLFRQGKLYYDYGVYDSAVKIWGGLIEKFPGSPYTQGAGELLLDSFNRAKNYENIEIWARRLKAAPAFAAPAQQAKLDALIVQGVFKQGEQKTAAGDHAGAAKAYLRAAKEFPREPRAAQACVNATVAAQRAGDLALLKEAATLATSKEYRDRPESPESPWIAATTLQSMGLFSEAAEFAESIGALHSKEYPHYQKFEHTKDAAYNAVVLRVATGETEKAIVNGNRFLASFPTAPEADDVVFEMGRAHQNAGRTKEAIDLYRRYIAKAKRADRRIQGYVLLAVAELKAGDERAADASLRDAVSMGKRRRGELGPEGKAAAARARYMEGERLLAQFERIQIAGDVKQLSSRLRQKADYLKRASGAFLDTAQMGVAEWTTAALYQVGYTYESFAKALKESPAPAQLSEEEKEAYRQQIEEFVVPIEERSLDAYENGWKKAVELGIYNQWTAKMREALGRLNSELYPPLREIGFEVRMQAPTPMPPLIDAPRRAVLDRKDNKPRGAK